MTIETIETNETIDKKATRERVGQFVRGIKFRLIALSVGIFGLALIVLAAILFEGIKDLQQKSFDTSLYNHAVDVANSIDTNILGDLIVRRDLLIEENKILPFALGQSLLQIRTLNGEVILTSRGAGRRGLPWNPQTARRIFEVGALLVTGEVNGVDHRILYFPLRKGDGFLSPLPPLVLTIAAPMTLVNKEREQILTLLWTLIPLALGAAAFAGFMTSKKAFEPVDKIIASAQAIQGHQLELRVPVPRETELRELATTLNDLLARLEMAFKGQEQFIADASHQLRTPLAIIRGEIDVFRRHPRSQEENDQLLESLSQEVDQLSRLVEELLLLAKFDSGRPLRPFQPVRVDEVLLGTVSQLAKLADEKKVELHYDVASNDVTSQNLASNDVASEEGFAEGDSGFDVPGDEELLRVVFFNLIENSIKYTPSGKSVRIKLAASREHVDVAVEDEGPGIRQEDQKRIFDRFYRSIDQQQSVAGAGLGLSIAQRIARLHGASLSVESVEGQGARFRFQMKRS